MTDPYTPTTGEPLPLEVSILRYLTENWSEKLDNIDRIVLASGLSVALAAHDVQVRAEALREATAEITTDKVIIPHHIAMDGGGAAWVVAIAHAHDAIDRIADTNQTEPDAGDVVSTHTPITMPMYAETACAAEDCEHEVECPTFDAVVCLDCNSAAQRSVNPEDWEGGVASCPIFGAGVPQEQVDALTGALTVPIHTDGNNT